MKIAVTTSRRPNRYQLERAKRIAADLNLPLIEERVGGIVATLSQYELDYLLVVQNDKLIMKNHETEFFWHPGTAIKKIWELKQRKSNILLNATAIEEGDTVLDCTLGFGSDAILMAYAVGATGYVHGLEANRFIAYLTREALESNFEASQDVSAFVKRIKVYNQNYEVFLPNQADRSYDVVYFDPMFRNPNHASNGIQGLRAFAHDAPITRASIDEALRVCRKRVVVKERIGSGVFKALGISQRLGEIKFGSVVYGYIEKP